MQPHLENLIASIEHAEEIVKRMEETTDIAEHNKATNEILGMHRFIMKVYAVVLAVVVFAVATGGMVVTRMIVEEEHHQAQDVSKYENLINTVKSEQVSNQQMIQHLIVLTEELYSKRR